jgi:hypothetical protein
LWHPISRQRPKYVHATIEKVLQEVFSMWFAPCQLLSNDSPNTFPQKQTCGKVGNLLLGNSAVNRLCQKCRLCFLYDPCRVVIRESNFEAGSSVQKTVENRENENENGASLRQSFITSCCNWLWLREIVQEGVNKSNYRIQEPIIISPGAVNSWQYYYWKTWSVLKNVVF